LRRGKESLKNDKSAFQNRSLLSALKSSIKRKSLDTRIIMMPDVFIDDDDFYLETMAIASVLEDELLDIVKWKTIPDEIPLDEKGIKIVKAVMNSLIFETKEVPIRPQFLKYCGEGDKYSFKYFETPMDYLQQIINNIPGKKKTKTVDISDIIPKPDFRKADNHQLNDIIEYCEKADGYIKVLQSKQNISDEIKYSRIREVDNEVIQKLKKRKINDNTIRIILYKAFSEKKYHDEKHKKYRMMGRRLTGWLYQAHPETFKP
jgi:hypothetical protein